MRAPISVIIPTLNAADTLPLCLAALMEGLDAGLIRDVVVADGGSADATGAIAQAWGAGIIDAETSRGGQLRRGCAVAQGDWLLIVHADTVLQPGWSRIVSAHLGASKAAWFQLAFDNGGMPGKMVAGWANMRSHLGLPYGDQGLILPRVLYEDVGGYPDQPLMEDVALARALKGQLVGLPIKATTSPAKYQSQGWMRRGGRNLWTLMRYALGTSPETLARSYRKPR